MEILVIYHAILTMSFSGFAFLIIKFNDFKHLEDSMKIQNSTIKGLADAIILQGKQIAKIEGILEIKE